MTMTRMHLSAQTKPMLLAGFFLLSLLSCDDHRFFEESVKIDGSQWHSDNIITFSTVISDTISAYNFSFDVRNDITYSYSNLYLFMKTIFPNGRITRDTIECMLAAYDGKWIGSGTGNLRFNRFLYQTGIRFRIPGTYQFEVEQAMRVEVLKGISDIGIRIDKLK